MSVDDIGPTLRGIVRGAVARAEERLKSLYTTHGCGLHRSKFLNFSTFTTGSTMVRNLGLLPVSRLGFGIIRIFETGCRSGNSRTQGTVGTLPPQNTFDQHS